MQQRTLMTADEVAEHYRWSKWFVYTKAKQGLIPSARIAGKVLFCKESLDNYLENLEGQSIAK